MKNIVALAVEKMIAFYNGNTRDINHFLKVWSYARTIGELEGLDSHTLRILELTAVVHDISCPLCRIKYGNTDGRHQEEESAALVGEFFSDFPLPEEDKARISYIVSHHHTYTDVDAVDYQILLEADFLVNADENGLDRQHIETFRRQVFRTQTGSRILDSIYHLLSQRS